jgi:MarR family transcriptional regulator for hemolysin
MPPARLRFGFRFVVLARQWRRALDERFTRAGLSDATWTTLIHLQELGDGATQKQLAAQVGIDASSLVRLLDILEGQGLIERRAGEADRRARHLFLTEAGHARVAELRAPLLEAEREMLAEFSDAELDGLLEAFDRIEAGIERLRARP